MRKFSKLLTATLIVVPVAFLSACAPNTDSSSHATSTEAPSAEKHSSQLELAKGWSKAGGLDGMTGVFGKLSNASNEDLTIESVESADAGKVELHEVTAAGIMQEIKGDVIVPANGSLELVPGGNHIMLMELKKDLLAGDEVSFTLHLKSKSGKTSSAEFSVLVKDYAGANENYGSGEHASGEHGEHEQDTGEPSGDSHDSH